MEVVPNSGESNVSTPSPLPKASFLERVELPPLIESPFLPSKSIDNYICCSICNKDIRKTIQFYCAVCMNFPMCKQCFMSKSETDTHKSTHSYRVNHNLKSIMLYQEGWSASSELHLVEGLEHFRFGNWEEITPYVDNMSEHHVVHHYIECYLNQPDSLPVDHIIPDHFTDPMDEEVPAFSGRGSDISGYMPLRDDYDIEYDNDAELMLKDVDILGDEDEREKELKMCILRAFNRRLDEREKRKQFVLQYELLDYKQIMQQERKRSKEVQEVISKLKPFQRVLPREEYDALVNGMIREVQLRERIQKLQKGHKNGLRTLEEVDGFEREIRSPPDARVETEIDDAGDVLDVSRMAFVEHLSQEEIRLCSLLHLTPQNYIYMKNMVIQECSKNGIVSPDNMQQRITVEIEKSKKVFEFFINSGWINDPMSSSSNTKPTTGPSNS